MPKKQQKMASNKKMQENNSTLKFNFTQEYVWPVLIWGVFCSDGPNHCPNVQEQKTLAMVLTLSSL